MVRIQSLDSNSPGETMITVEYDPKAGMTFPDAEVQQYVNNVIKYRSDQDYYLVVGNEIAITAFRLAVVNGSISPEQIVFVFNGEKITPNKNGGLSNWPKGFCDYTQNLLAELFRSRRLRK